MINQWRIEHTLCYPKAFKIVNDSIKPDNDSSNFFVTVQEALTERDLRNGGTKEIRSTIKTLQAMSEAKYLINLEIGEWLT